MASLALAISWACSARRLASTSARPSSLALAISWASSARRLASTSVRMASLALAISWACSARRLASTSARISSLALATCTLHSASNKISFIDDALEYLRAVLLVVTFANMTSAPLSNNNFTVDSLFAWAANIKPVLPWTVSRMFTSTPKSIIDFTKLSRPVWQASLNTSPSFDLSSIFFKTMLKTTRSLAHIKALSILDVVSSVMGAISVGAILEIWKCQND